MKKSAFAFAAALTACMALAACGSETLLPDAISSSAPSAALPQSVSAPPAVPPASAQSLPGFGKTTGVSGAEPAFEHDLICDWTDVEPLLADADYTAEPLEGLEEILSGQQPPPPNGMTGFRVYETPGLRYLACMRYAGEGEEKCGWVSAVLCGGEYRLKNGLGCGMTVEAAKTLIDAYNTPRYEFALSAAGPDSPETAALSNMEMLRPEQFPPGMFEDCALAIAVPYTISDEGFGAVGRVLCLYSKTGATVDYITAALWGAG